MSNSANNNIQSRSRVKRPIRRTLISTAVLFFLILGALVFVLYRSVFSKLLYNRYESKADEIITYVENNLDADDLERCLATGETSETYDAEQLFLNGMVDDLGLEYLYIVIPDPDDAAMINAISATSAAEFEAGDDNMPLGMRSYYYSSEELARYKAFWDSDKINYFEESSEWGEFYTACKPLRNSSGSTVALICVDLSIHDLHATINRLTTYSLLAMVLLFAAFVILIGLRVRNNLTKPLYALVKSAHEYAMRDKRTREITGLYYDAPKIETRNEVQMLSEAIEDMTNDMREYVGEVVAAEMRASRAEQENERLAEQAAAAKKIADLTESVNTLLTNMPALTFYKEIKTGVYLACNLAFAIYAGKSSPEEVVGHTDHELFDPATAEHFVTDDHKAFNMDRPYSFIEDVFDADGSPKRFQTTKQKFTDTAGRLCLLGMCIDVTDVMESEQAAARAKEAYEQARSASLTYSRLARALSADYVNLFYVNIDNETFIEYHSDVQKEDLVVEQQGEDFFNIARRDARTLLHKDDVELFLNTFSRKNILDKINQLGSFTLTYRTRYGVGEDEYTYVNMKASRLADDDVHIIIGVSSINEQMKYQEALSRVQEERITYSRITALSGEYLVIYTVDPFTHEYSEYSATDQFKTFDIAKSGSDFFTKARENSLTAVFPDDLEMFMDAFTVENVMNDIENNGIFSVTYRLMIADAPTWIELKAARVEEKDGPKLIVGISNIDARVKREQEFSHDLSVARDLANIDALTHVKNKHVYVDTEAEINARIEHGEQEPFAVTIFDVNGLKQVNDTLGHRAGDEWIRSACGIICEVFDHSPVFRIGGDEFVIIAQDGDYERIDELVEKIAVINRQNAAEGKVVVACGMAKFDGDRNVAAVFERADKEMYENKRKLKEDK